MKITPKHIIAKRKLSKRKTTCRVIISAGPTEDFKTDKTHQTYYKPKCSQKSLRLGQIIASSHGKRLICAYVERVRRIKHLFHFDFRQKHYGELSIFIPFYKFLVSNDDRKF